MSIVAVAAPTHEQLKAWATKNGLIDRVTQLQPEKQIAVLNRIYQISLDSYNKKAEAAKAQARRQQEPDIQRQRQAQELARPQHQQEPDIQIQPQAQWLARLQQQQEPDIQGQRQPQVLVRPQQQVPVVIDLANDEMDAQPSPVPFPKQQRRVNIDLSNRLQALESRLLRDEKRKESSESKRKRKEPSELEESDPKRQRSECAVCLDAEPEIVLVPCGHECTCAACSKQLKEAKAKCPICRAEILHFQRVIKV
jgi:hypothetical protein